MARGRDGLFKRCGVFGFRYKDSADVWRERSTGEHDRKSARGVRDEFLNDLANNALPNDEIANKRLEEAAKWWLNLRRLQVAAAKPTLAASTQAAEMYRLKPLPRIIGNKRLSEITNHDLDYYAITRQGEGCGPWSINKEVLVWSQILKKAKLWKRLREDYHSLKTTVSDIGQALSREQLRKLAAVAESNIDWEGCFYAATLAANCGLRGGEVKRLRIDSIDMEHRRLIVRRCNTKTDAGARHVNLNSDALKAVARLLLRYRQIIRKAGINSSPDHYLLPKHLSRIAHGVNKGSRGYDPAQHQVYWDTAWHSLSLAAGLLGLRFHDLRHSFITAMVERGVPIGVIQSQVGHMSARMVMHYTHVSSGVGQRAVDLLNAEPMLPELQELAGESTRSGLPN